MITLLAIFLYIVGLLPIIYFSLSLYIYIYNY